MIPATIYLAHNTLYHTFMLFDEFDKAENYIKKQGYIEEYQDHGDEYFYLEESKKIGEPRCASLGKYLPNKRLTKVIVENTVSRDIKEKKGKKK